MQIRTTRWQNGLGMYIINHNICDITLENIESIVY